MKEKDIVILVEQYADNGEHSHWELINHEGEVVWASGKIVLDKEKFEEILKEVHKSGNSGYYGGITEILKNHGINL